MHCVERHIFSEQSRICGKDLVPGHRRTTMTGHVRTDPCVHLYNSFNHGVASFCFNLTTILQQNTSGYIDHGPR